MVPENFRVSDKILTIPEKNSLRVIPVEEIILFERCRSGTSIICIKEDHITSCKATLSSFEAAFAPKGFFRIHKSYLVNTFYICKFNRHEGDLVTMYNRKEYPVSRAKCSDFEEAMLKPFRDLMANTTDRSPKTTDNGCRFTVRGFLSEKLLTALYIWQIISDTATIESCLC